MEHKPVKKRKLEYGDTGNSKRQKMHETHEEEQSKSEDSRISTTDNSTSKRKYEKRDPPDYQVIRSNIYPASVKRFAKTKRENGHVCTCTVEPDGIGCGRSCVNRQLYYECNPELCPCGQNCTNTRLQNEQYAKIKLINAGRKGHGVEILQNLQPGDLIIEYVGEVITTSQCVQRMKSAKYKKDKHFYFLTIDSQLCIDASRKGNLARFINHSCDPNCRTEKWVAAGQTRVGIFAIKPIQAGTELTFDYQFVRFGLRKQRCYCGSDNCRRYLGSKRVNKTKTGKKQKAPNYVPNAAHYKNLIDGIKPHVLGTEPIDAGEWDIKDKATGQKSRVVLRRNIRKTRQIKLCYYQNLLCTYLEKERELMKKKEQEKLKEVRRKRESLWMPSLPIESLVKKGLVVLEQ